MKTYTKNEVKEKNYMYCGVSSARRKNLQAKPGTSRQQDINKRFSAIRTKEPDFEPMGYLTIYNVSKARLEALEASVKADIVEHGFQHTGNDHFEFRARKDLDVKSQYCLFCGMALAYAIDYCKAYNLTYELTWLVE